MMMRLLIVFIFFVFSPSIVLAEENKVPINCLKGILIVLDDIADRGRNLNLNFFVDKSEYQNTCGIDENKPNEVYLLFNLLHIDEKGRKRFTRPSYRIDIENKTIVEFKGRA